MKSMVITGGSTGIGEATVKKFSEQGYQVFNLDKNEPLHQYANTHYIACDVSKPAQIQHAISSILPKMKTLDVVVASAGKHLSATIEETSESEFDDLMNINVKGTFFLLKNILPILKSQKSGNIILVGSEQCTIGKRSSAVYGATKGAIAQLTKSTALDCAVFKICVNAVCPGTIDTPLYQKAIEQYHVKTGIPLEKIEKEEAAQQPINRIGLPEEVADLIFFLGSNAAGFITGGLFPIDGGYTAQ